MSSSWKIFEILCLSTLAENVPSFAVRKWPRPAISGRLQPLLQSSSMKTCFSFGSTAFFLIKLTIFGGVAGVVSYFFFLQLDR